MRSAAPTSVLYLRFLRFSRYPHQFLSNGFNADFTITCRLIFVDAARWSV